MKTTKGLEDVSKLKEYFDSVDPHDLLTEDKKTKANLK